MEGGRAVDENLLHDLPDEYAALADRRTVMREVAAQLQELHAAVTRLGDALEGAGLPGRAWRSADARLRLLPAALPDITVDAFIARVAEFAAGKGPDRLHGDDADLELFHKEVAAIYGVAQRLQRVVQDLDGAPATNRRGARLARALGDGRVRAALDDIGQILGDFKALRPFMAPLTRQEWESSEERPSQAMVPAAPPSHRGLRETLPMPPSTSHTRLRDFASVKDDSAASQGWNSRIGGRLATLRAVGAALRRSIRSFLGGRSPAQNRLAAIAIVVFLGLLGAGVGVVLAQPHAPALPAARTPVSAPTATAAPATATPRPSTTPPKLTLTCAAQGTTAKLTIQNVGTTSGAWQAQSPSGLRIVPDHGSLDAGQSATAQVSAINNKRPATGTVTVTATSGATSASFSVSCA
jgi:hypothetical protein